MEIAPDTNVLIRAILLDDAQQAAVASQLLRSAQRVAISLPCLCEMVWVLRRNVKLSRAEVGLCVRDLLNAENVALNRQAVEYGLAIHDAGGDFADGIMAFEGGALGGHTFVSFDRQAVKLLAAQGWPARSL